MCFLDSYFEINLGTRKTAQSGVLHSWRLHANDSDIRICPMRILIQLALIYEPVEKSGPLFLQVSAHGAVLPDHPIVCLLH